MIPSKSQNSASQNVSHAPLLSFIPQGILRTIAEFIVAVIPGSLLLFAFFIMAEVALYFTKNDLISVVFLPVICILPIFAGMISALFLEKILNKFITFQIGAAVGAVAGFLGSMLSALVLLVLSLFGQAPLGSFLNGPLLVAVVLLLTIAIDTILGALGGVIVVKFVKDF